MGAIVPRVLGALRPGGWVLVAMANAGTDPLGAAFAQTRTIMWGGPTLSAADTERLLAEAGSVGAMTLPAPPGSPAVMVAAQRGGG